MAEPYEPDFTDTYRNYLFGSGPEAIRRQRAQNPVSVAQFNVLHPELAGKLGDPSQMQDVTKDVPSEVPHYQLTSPPSQAQPYPQAPAAPPTGPSVGDASDPRYQGFQPAQMGQPGPQQSLAPPEGPLTNSYDMGPDQSGWAPHEPPQLRPMGLPSVVHTPLTPPGQETSPVSMRGMQPGMQMQEQQGAPQRVTTQEENPNAPANYVERQLVEAEIAKERRYPPRSAMGGSAGTQTLEAKIHNNYLALMDQDPQADPTKVMSQARLMATGGADILGRSEGRKSLDESRKSQDKNREYTHDYLIQRLNQRERDTNLREAVGADLMRHRKFVDDEAKRMADAGKAPGDIAFMRAEEKKKMDSTVVAAWLHDHGNLGPEDLQKNMEDLISFQRRVDTGLYISPPTKMPTEIGGVQIPPPIGGANIPFTGGKETYQPKDKTPGLGESGAQLPPNEQPGPVDEFEGAPAGKAVGDVLKEGGKPVAKWDGKRWQRIR